MDLRKKSLFFKWLSMLIRIIISPGSNGELRDRQMRKFRGKIEDRFCSKIAESDAELILYFVLEIKKPYRSKA